MISFAENIKPILDTVVRINPQTILDVGFGFGKYGLLCREAIMSNRAEKGDLIPIDNIWITGLEMADYFLSIKWAKAPYNETFKITDSIKMFKSKKTRFDLGLLIDVVEHHEDMVSKRLILEVLERCDRVLISTPKTTCMYEEEYYGEDCPKHKMQWSKEMFDEFAGQNSKHIEWVESDVSYICVISN